MDDVESVSITEASNGSYFLMVRKPNGYTDEYSVKEREAKYLFNRLGRLLEQKAGGVTHD